MCSIYFVRDAKKFLLVFVIALLSISSFADANKPPIKKVDNTTLTGKVMCGYQGWFGCPNDGSHCGWSHYGYGQKFKPGKCVIDLWPDVSEFDKDEKYPTSFRHADGNVAYVFSSYNKKTVLRHFKWMQEYGIDGVFVQRFPVALQHENTRNFNNTVLGHCKEAAALYGRTYAVMYDITDLDSNGVYGIRNDWKYLVDKLRITKGSDANTYLYHKSKPVVVIWGIGFSEKSRLGFTMADCKNLVEFFKNDPCYGNCTVMLGLPSGWRTLTRDCINDKTIHEIALKADIISPWTVGRYSDLKTLNAFVESHWIGDIKWCKENGKDYMPVVFPGFSWHNMHPDSALNLIPASKANSSGTQYYLAQKAGAKMIYQAMFDEINEGTAILKCTNNPPTGLSQFATYEGLPSDYYLWLVGTASKMLRGEIPL